MLGILLPILATSLCTPVLTSPAGDDGDDTGGWEAPENTWPVADAVPSDLVGEGFNEGQVIPEILLMDQFGDEVSLWQFYGSVIAVDTSTGWCGPCAALADEVDAVQADYADQGFIYVTMLPQDAQGEVPELDDLQGWADTHSITAPILADTPGWSYQIVPDQAWPQVMIVGRDMKVAVRHVSPVEDNAIRAAIEGAL